MEWAITWKLRLLYKKGDMMDRVRQFWLASYHEQLFLKPVAIYELLTHKDRSIIHTKGAI